MEKKRKSDRPLTPGERAINWAKAFMVIAPLFGAGYFANTDTVKRLYAEEAPVPETTTVVPETPTPEPVLSATAAPAKVIERTIIRDCGASEVMISHIKALH